MMQYKEIKIKLKERIKIPILQEEYWYGGCVMDGSKYPFTANDGYSLDLINLDTVNQAAPAFLSTKGRVVWSKQPFNLTVKGNQLEVIAKSTIYMDESGQNLKDAQAFLAQQTFSLGTLPPQAFFQVPQWNTWIEVLYNQNQNDILKYAQGILDHQFPAGIMIIDDSWAEYCGRWEFSERKFPDPKQMVAQLHSMGFKVMLWVCPFITADTVEYRYLSESNMLLRQKDGKIAIREWWNGHSAILDLSNPAAYSWLKESLVELQNKYHIDGFKFDAGDQRFYRNDDISYMKLTAQQQTELWGQFGAEFPYNEFRSNYQNQGWPLINRLQDKAFEWGKDGLADLIPHTLAQGLLGYYFNCPDMIGGGDYFSFRDKQELDQELIVRFAQCSALMAMMQFSVAPWRVLDQEHLKVCKAAADLHIEYADYILQLARYAAEKGEPITRPMSYDHPQTPIKFLKTQFKLGEDLLAAPVLEKGASEKEIYFPAGKWQAISDNKEIITGPIVKKVPVNLASLPAYKRITE
ncbi:glycoside hydrolase family 31 protein [Liquorilactobacillus capillatus]|uniref:Glycoside hydrolase n=1 Tax=Liquorilactobacillus capillatus DSM 19910 TaxID=1423731 RepID=A0A0R1M6M6_9LACO|nr:glycoside hydrolase family 31 protein [Liquorilactobacillus capillatus]KRL03537.1 hypothetical protein FC81_GL001791 [Liquorilactobacillus capillatus DSM 19910]